jgi:chemotaxis protein CheD
MREVIVPTGGIAFAESDTTLSCPALGSCIAVIAYDPRLKKGCLAHIMLPGKAPAIYPEKIRYSSDAITKMISLMKKNGSTMSNIDFSIVGGANVLGREGDRIPSDNIRQTRQELLSLEANIVAQATGGFERYSVSIDLSTGQITYSVGDHEKTRLLPQ